MTYSPLGHTPIVQEVVDRLAQERTRRLIREAIQRGHERAARLAAHPGLDSTDTDLLFDQPVRPGHTGGRKGELADALLNALRDQGEQTTRQLADRVGRTIYDAGKSLRKLEARGLVTRDRASRDNVWRAAG